MIGASSSFSRLLRNHRRAAGLTQEELAERAGLSARAISDLERGVKIVPHLHTVELLAQALNLPVEDLERAVPRRRGPRMFQTLAQLPFAPTSFVGRETETYDVIALLRQPETRLVTVTGPPGIGKTRLSLAVAEKASEEFAGGVVFVPLAPLRDSALAVSSLAQALGIQRSASSSIEQRVIDYLQTRHLLLILDNFEHVLDVAEVVARVLAACPRVKALVTSRAALNIQGEYRFELRPLDVPPPGIVPALDEVSRYPAILLFSERAAAVNPGFRITPGNLPAIVGICQRLNGLPLAIELASARSNVLPPPALLQRLESQLQLLTGGSRDLPERHRTMRSAIAWSYDLLEDSEQRLFRQLAIFAGNFSLEAAEAVAILASESDSVLDGLTSLIDQNLVLAVPAEPDEVWFAMLDSIQEFGLEQFARSGERDAISARHCDYYVGLAERGYDEQVGNRQALWFRRLERELNNLRAAAAWIVEQNDDSRAARLGLSLWRFWERAHIAEGRRWLDAFLQLPALLAPNPSRCPLLFAAGRLAYRQADYASAGFLLDECLVIARAENDVDFTGAALAQLGHVDYAQGNLDSAEHHYTESLTIRRQEGDARTIGITLHGLARVQRARGDYAGARALLHERLAISRKTQDVIQISMALAGLGLVALLEGDYSEADRFYHESLARSREVDDQPAVAIALLGLAFAAVGRGEPELARPLLREGLLTAREIGARHLIAQSLEGFTTMLVALGEAPRAWMLAAAVAAYRERVAVPRDPSEHALLELFLESAAQSLDSDERASLWAAGRDMTLADAYAEVGLTISLEHRRPLTLNLDDEETIEQEA